MKNLLVFAILTLGAATSARAQFVLPATTLLNIPAGDSQKVILAGWQHCDVNNSCTTGGSSQVFRFANGGNAYDRAGNMFSPVIGDRSGISVATSLSLLHVNGTITKFADVPQYLCTSLTSNSILWQTQDLWVTDGYGAPSFNSVANTLQLVTVNQAATYTAGDAASTVKCLSSSTYAVSGDEVVVGPTDTTNAYITITGPVL